MDLARNHDLIIHGSTVYDGSGATGQRVDVAVADGRIAAIGNCAGMRATETIDAAGLALAPGFIDSHAHDDRALLERSGLEPKLSQGVTTVITGNCGLSLAPLQLADEPPPPLDLLGSKEWFRFASFATYADAVDAAQPLCNAAALIGHTTLRLAAMPRVDRAADASEIGTMRQTLARSLAEGAFGFSTGLAYTPAKEAPASEVEALLQCVAAAGGVYATHLRSEGDGIEAALDEAFTSSGQAGVPLVVSHHKCAGRANWGRSTRTLARIKDAQTRQSIGLDAYPYTASSTSLDEGMAERSPRTIVTWSAPHPDAAGRDLAKIAAGWKLSAREAAIRLMPGGAVYFIMDESDVRRILSFPDTMIGSDGLPHDTHPHPRLYGTFARVLGHYAREVGLFPLAEAVRRMTSLPAMRFGLADRGRIAAGFAADLVLFDPQEIDARASFEEPRQFAAGVKLVAVNGRIAWRAGAATGARAGRLLRRPALRAAA
ncbi:MAG: D-aminoacylase [Alphaproteobacteria bacterium]|nr:D-aminoacylase [Alphaproteobacteria bacterium]